MMGSEEFVPNEQLRRARSLKGWSQAELAERVGTSFEMVSRWERGLTLPSPYFRERLCNALDKTPQELGWLRDLKELVTPSPAPLVLLASSHADADKVVVTQLKTALQERGITLWSSRQLGRQGGEHPRKALREIVRSAQVVLLILSPEARSSRHIREALRMAKMYQRSVYGIWIEGEHWQQCLPSDYGQLGTMIDARKGYDRCMLDELVATLEPASASPPSQESSFPATAPDMVPDESSEAWEPQGKPRNPYKGLRAFRREDRDDFFGRDTLIAELAAALEAALLAEQQHRQSARLLAVVGPSGSGKSSVVLAGLLPRLQEGGLPGSEAWVYLDPIVPGVHPLESLALTLAAHLPDRSLHTLREDLESDSARGLHLLATALAKQRETKVVLFVDQFEEVFSQTTAEEERQHFLDLLITAMTEPQGPVIVLVTLRADFSDRLMHYPELYRLFETHDQAVLPMEVAELRAIIEQPAALPDVQLTFEGNLVGDLLFETYGQVGALPLLEFTLAQLFERRRGHTLTLQAYQEVGGLKGALAQQAETTYASLHSEEDRRLARALFLRLVDPGATEQDTMRRRAARSELLLREAKQTVLLQEVATAFVAARLLTASEVGGIATLEVSHEALIREWARMANWLREAREDIRLLQAVSRDAAEWRRHKQPADRLYRGSQLKEARAWARRNTPSDDEVAFLHASTARRARAVAGVLVVVLLVLSSIGTAGWFLTHQVQVPDPTRVTNLLDHGPGSLRQAVDLSPAGSTITFHASLSGTILLTSSDLNIVKNLTIRGPLAHPLAISSGTSKHSVHVYTGVSVTISHLIFKESKGVTNSPIFNEGTLTLSNSIVSGNSAQQNGGGIYNRGTLTLNNSIVSGNSAGAGAGGGIVNGTDATLTLSNSTVSGNSADFGGGILNGINATLTLSNSIVSGNSAQQGGGGGIFNYNSDTLTLSNSIVSGNSTQQEGGGISNGGILTLNNSTISDNSAQQEGGGIYNSGTLTLSNSIVSNNTSDSSGGGIVGTFNERGRLTLTNSTVSSNTAFGNGGGIAVVGRQADITFCTIYGNKAVGNGGGLSIKDGTDFNGNKVPSRVSIRNSIIAGDHATTGPDISGALTSYGYNLIQNASGVRFLDPLKKHATDVAGKGLTDLRFDSKLRANGGSTQTYALLPGSPVIDRIPLNECLVNGISTDQRGVKRPQGSACDIGAYEYVPSP